jgi:hypothetical protein
MIIRFKNKLKTMDKGVQGEAGYVRGAYCDVIFEGRLLAWGQEGADQEIWPCAIIAVKEGFPVCRLSGEFIESQLNQKIRTATVGDILQTWEEEK